MITAIRRLSRTSGHRTRLVSSGPDPRVPRSIIFFVQRLLPRVLPPLLAALILAEIFILVPRPAAVTLVAAAVWMAVPGVVLVRHVFPGANRPWLLAWLLGPALGFGFSVFGAFVLWAAGVQTWLAIVLGPWLTLLVAAAGYKLGGPRMRLPTLGRADVAAVSLAMLIVPLVTWVPYSHVRLNVGDGEAYRAYFTADFVWAITVTTEIAKGDMPPHNPFLKDRPLHYYWLSHFLSGAVYRNIARAHVTHEQVVLVNGVLFGVAAIGFFYALARMAGAGPWLSLLGVALGFLANSYEGADMIRAIVEHGQSWDELRNVNVDAVTRWFYKGMPVDGLQRMLLYQPHHLTGYVMALAALWLVGFAEDVAETSVALWAGVLLAFALLFSTFTAIIVGAAVGLLFALRLTQQRRWPAAIGCVVLGGVPIGVGVALTKALGYTDDRYGFLLAIGLNPVALEHLGRVLLLSFGPLLFGAVLTLVRWRWMLRDGAAATTLVIAAFAFYFFANVPDAGDVWVGWRSGHLLLIAFGVMTACVLQDVWQVAWSRKVVAIPATVAILLGTPTVAVDIYNAQDIHNRAMGADFPWTLVITPLERQALDWIRTSTPQKAVVQAEPYIRGNKHWSYIPGFAERRSVAGLPIAMTPLRPYREASDDVYWGIFRARSADEAHNMATFLGIDFLALGVPERRAYVSGIAQIAARPDLFTVVFRNDEMTIFRVD